MRNKTKDTDVRSFRIHKSQENWWDSAEYGRRSGTVVQGIQIVRLLDLLKEDKLVGDIFDAINKLIWDNNIVMSMDYFESCANVKRKAEEIKRSPRYDMGRLSDSDKEILEDLKNINSETANEYFGEPLKTAITRIHDSIRSAMNLEQKM